ncbi:MAG: hypothetical protein DRN54_03905 [Thaumarchaeota archaeon]|nr:MAG: hypothetical protein DRN54_03905 [Nitrososphaerota archaeon]
MPPYTPTKEEIYDKAVELWMKMNPAFTTIPEEKELKEDIYPPTGRTYWEEAKYQLMAKPETRYREMLLADLEREARELEAVVLKEEDYAKLLKAQRELEKIRKKIKELEAERAAERRRYEEEIRRLKEELAGIPPRKYMVMSDFEEGIMKFKAGQIIETRNIDWAEEKVKEGLLEPYRPPPPAKPPVKVVPPTVPKPPKKPLKEFPEEIERLRKALLEEAERQFILQGLKREDFLANRADVVAAIRTAILMYGELPKEEAEEKIRAKVESAVKEIIRKVKRPRAIPPPVAAKPTALPLPPEAPKYGIYGWHPWAWLEYRQAHFRPNMTATDVIKLVKELYGWNYNEKQAASMYYHIILKHGWPVPEWVKRALNLP